MSDNLVGIKWGSPRGQREVIDVRKLDNGSVVLVIETEGVNQLQLLPPDQLDREIKLDTQPVRGSTPKNQHPMFDDLGYTDQFSALQAGKKQATLTRPITYREKLWLLGNLIKYLVESGSVVVVEGGQRRLISIDGNYLDEKQITKTGMDFAEYIGDQQ